MVLGVAIVAVAAGFGQFGLIATLGSVARHFGHLVQGSTITDRAGLSGTELGLGLAVVRLASLGGLPLAGLADRLGRRRVMLVGCGVGLAVTAVSAVSPGYWWFVVIFALGRPFLSAAAAVAQVAAAEQTTSDQRASAVALVAAGYAVGAGIIAVLYGLVGGVLGYRGILVLTVVPLVALPFVAKLVSEPDRFVRLVASKEAQLPVLGAVGRPYRRRLMIVTSVAFGLAVITGPATSFAYLYAQNVERLPGVAISGMVVAAGALGLGGLLVGTWLADHIGRRPTSAASLVAIGLAGVLSYSGGRFVFIGGYLAGIISAGAFAPAAGAFGNELFPTSIRSSVAGWNVAASVLGAVVGLVAFGSVVQVDNRFSTAAVVTFLPAVLVSGLVFLLPETRGRELESLWPTPTAKEGPR